MKLSHFHRSTKTEGSRRGPIEMIIEKRSLIEKLFLAAIVFSLICIPFVKVNYDLSKYLPDTVPSKQGLNLMEKEFGYPGTARIMVGDVSLYEAKVFKDRIEAVDGVDMVLWADTTTDIYQSNLFIDYGNIEDYYKDGYAVYDVTFEEEDSSQRTHDAIDEIKKITGDKGYFTGSAVQNKSLSETLIREVAIAMVMGVFMIALVLCLTTNSWFEPFMFLMVMGIAIVINMGTNIFLGTVSFLTFSVASILQLAIAMDYSIFLLHTFTHERESGLEPVPAIANAIRKSVSSILSSGATTIVGFIVLTLMKFTIGRDLGIVLAKGIVISLLTVLLLMPALILRWSDKVEKTRHRSFIPSLEPLGKGILKIRFLVFLAVALLVIPAYTAQNMNSFTYGNDSLGSSPGTQVYEDDKAINEHFGRSNLLLAIVPNTNVVTEREFTEALEDLSYTKSVTSLAGTLPEGIPESFVPESVTGLLHTENYSRILIYIRTANESPLAFQCSDEIQKILHTYYPENSYLVGVTPSTQDIEQVITTDYNFVNILSLLGVAIVILITFRSLIIPIIVMIPIEVAIFFNMALPYLYGDTMIYMGYIIVSCLQLGATVDYSILLTNNYLDARVEFGKREAALQAISRSALSILTSGSILTIVGYGLYFTSSVAAIGDIGRLVGRGALLSMGLVLTMLPVLLTMSDRLIFNQIRRVKKLEHLREMGHKEIRLSLKYLQKQRRTRFKKLLRIKKREARRERVQRRKQRKKLSQIQPVSKEEQHHEEK